MSVAVVAFIGLCIATADAEAAPPTTPKDVADCIAQPDANIRECASRLKMICVLDSQRAGSGAPPVRSDSLLACMQEHRGSTADALKKCSLQAEARQRAARGATQQAMKACQDAIESRVSDFLTAEQTCVVTGSVSPCVALPNETDEKACFLRCTTVHEAAMNQSDEDEREACIGRYINANGKGRFACSLAGVPLKAENDAAVEAELKTALPAALKARDGATLDALVKRSDAQFLSILQTECTKRCLERAPNVLAVQKHGPSFVTAYKRCMVAADSTLEARKLNAYETDLYCDYITKANERCRASNKCDLVESNSDLECTYATPGTACPL